MKLEGAQFEISVDGKPRSLRDVMEVAFEAAQFLKGQNPKSDVAVRGLVRTKPACYCDSAP